MRDPANIRALASLRPDHMGFIFYEKSPRYAGGMPPGAVAGVKDGVAVFVNAPYERITDVCDRYGFRHVQLHGEEPPDFCRRLREGGLRVFKAFGIGTDTDWESVGRYEGAVDMFVFDTATTSHGGSGRKFDWGLLARYPLATPYLLSGGIAPGDTVPSLPGMAGVDINSRFEISPGLKDIDLIRKFVDNEQNRQAFRTQRP